MLDKVLPEYLKTITTITAPDGSTRTSVINSATGGRIFRNEAPQGSLYPYIVVGNAFDIDFGITAQRNLLREVGYYNVVVVGQTLTSIDKIYRDVVDALKMVRNQYLPSSLANPKIWLQCIIPKDSEQFNDKPLDGSQTTMVGYIITIKAGYDP